MRRPAKGRFAPKRVPKLELWHEGKKLVQIEEVNLPDALNRKTHPSYLLWVLAALEGF